jgi:hypothetical protein
VHSATRNLGSLVARRARRGFAWWGLFLTTAACQEAVASDYLGSLQLQIEGGIAVEPCDWPAVVSLGGCSGTLVHRRLVVYAAHCGTAIGEVRFGVDAAQPDQVVATDHCAAYPGAQLGDGTDLAYCVLAQDVAGVEPARVLAGCEQVELESGREVQLVGFGVEEDGGSYGLARAAPAVITDVGDELLIEGDGVDTCRGDSGGPVFLPLTADSGLTELRLAGVTSAGSSPACGEGVAHYVNVARKIDWLEQASGLDLTPCFDRGSWAPTPECSSAAGTSACPAAREPYWLSTCGAAWQGEVDTKPPLVRFALPEEARVEGTLYGDQSVFDTAVQVVAEDDGTGVRGVTFTLRAADGTTLTERLDQLPPYELASLRLPAGDYVLEAKAEDFSAQSAAAFVEFQITAAAVSAEAPDRGCATTPARKGGSGRGGPWVGGLVLAAVLARCRKLRQMRGMKAAHTKALRRGHPTHHEASSPDGPARFGRFRARRLRGG